MRHTRLAWQKRWWLRVALWWAVFGIALAVELLWSWHAPREQQGHASVENSVCGLLSAPAERIVIETRQDRIVVERKGATWLRDGQAVPGDLAQAFLDALKTCASWPVVAAGERWREFGVDAPAVVVRIEAPTVGSVRLAFGNLNPTSTARYARLDDDPRVFLVGLQPWYYLELLSAKALDIRS